MKKNRWIPLIYVGMVLISTIVQRGWGSEDAALLTQAEQQVQQAQAAAIAGQEALTAEQLAVQAELNELYLKVQELEEAIEAENILGTQNTRRNAAIIEQARLSKSRLDFVRSALTEFSAELEGELNEGEVQHVEAELNALKQAVQGDDAELVDALGQAFLLAEQVNAGRFDSVQFRGRALDAEGDVLDGDFMVYGPLLYFRKGEVAGPAINRVGRILPEVYELDADQEHEVQQFFDEGHARVPLDVTKGRALVWAEHSQGVWDHFRSGGLVMVPIALIGLAALVIACMKGMLLGQLVRSNRRVQRDVILHCLQENQLSELKALEASASIPMSVILSTLVEYPHINQEDFEEIVHDRILACLPVLEKHMSMLAVLGAVSPLLGLLGTVTGIIHVFKMVTIFGTGDATLLSGGISEALVTTEAGLIIAIPVLLVHAVLARRIRRIIGDAEQLAIDISHEIKHGNCP